MNLRPVPSLTSFGALLVLLSIASCGSTSPSSNNMSPEDQRTWTAAREQHGVGVLDDRTFDVRISPKGKEKDISQPDTLEFAGGRMHSTACDEFGFGTSTYTTRQVDGGTEFHVVCKTPSGTTNDWHGTVRGDTIEGGFTFKQPGEEPLENVFHGHARK